ncbi:MAG: hypothetical protein ABI767_00795 [Rhodanobacter sp.]
MNASSDVRRPDRSRDGLGMRFRPRIALPMPVVATVLQADIGVWPRHRCWHHPHKMLRVALDDLANPHPTTAGNQKRSHRQHLGKNSSGWDPEITRSAPAAPAALACCFHHEIREGLAGHSGNLVDRTALRRLGAQINGGLTDIGVPASGLSLHIIQSVVNRCAIFLDHDDRRHCV